MPLPPSRVAEPAPRWDSGQYLRFEAERTRPCVDLVRRIELEAPARIVDLGCGPGTSTAVLRRRWPASELIGVDRSPEMLSVARGSDPSVRWVESDIGSWDPGGRVDLVFSNAALHWVPDHRRAIPRLWGWVVPGGALAFQVPVESDPPAPRHEALDALAARPRWRSYRRGDSERADVLSPTEYYELLSRGARSVDLWDTEYQHVLAGPEAIVEWVKGAGLRPWLEALPDDAERQAFLSEYRAEVERRYPRAPDGRVLFPFRRRFVVAYR
jgi:trans-aconitate 2-methyltransferase